MLSDADLFGRIEVKDNTHIGCDAMIMPNVTIGKNCIIGCHAVVTKDIPDNSVVAGVPARVIETIDEYYKKNKERCDFTKHMNAQDKKEYLVKKYNLDTK